MATAQRLLDLFRGDEARLERLGRSGPSLRLGYAALRRRPLTSTKQRQEMTGLSFSTGKAIEALVETGIAREITDGRRNRLFSFAAYLGILSEDTEPLWYATNNPTTLASVALLLPLNNSSLH